MKRLLFGVAVLLAMPLSACASAFSKTAMPETLHSYVLLDRTGSMADIWDEALISVNTYADKLAQGGDGDALQTFLTLAVFDAQDGFQFEVLRDAVPANAWMSVTNDEANPRGMTPLFDAIGRIVAMAEADDAGKAVIVIMTDGEENASRELTRTGAAAALDRARERGWEVVFLGAEFAKFDDADAVGVQRTRSMAVSKGAMAPVMESLAAKSRAYGKGEEEGVEFDAEDRAEAKEEEVKQRKGQ